MKLCVEKLRVCPWLRNKTLRFASPRRNTSLLLTPHIKHAILFNPNFILPIWAQAHKPQYKTTKNSDSDCVVLSTTMALQLLRSPLVVSLHFPSSLLRPTRNASPFFNPPPLTFLRISPLRRMPVPAVVEETQETSEPEPEPEAQLASELKKAMAERKEKEKENLLSGVAREIDEIEWPAFGKVLGTTGVVLAVIFGSSVVLLTLNAVLAQISDQLFAGKGVQDFFT